MNAITKPLFALFAAAALAPVALAEDLIINPPAAAQDSVVGIAARDGISVSDIGTLVTRNGVTQKVDKEIKLGNGSIVRADGTIFNGNGERLIIRPGQVLTFDGTLINPDAPRTTTTTITTEK
jgi:hypothetical protein